MISIFPHSQNESRSPAPLRVMLFHSPPLTSVGRHRDGSAVFSGYLVELWTLMLQQLPSVSYTLVETPADSASLGAMTENATWTGLIGELVNGRADVALNLFPIDPYWQRAVDYVDGVSPSAQRYGFYVHGSDQLSHALPALSIELLHQLMQPFSSGVWLALLGWIVTAAVVLRMSAAVELDQQRREMTVPACLLMTYQSLVAQGWALVPRSLAARVVAVSTWVVGIVSVASYTALATSTLAAHQEALPIADVSDFLRRSDWTLAHEPGVLQVLRWQDSEDGALRQLWQLSKSGQRRVFIGGNHSDWRVSTQQRVLSFLDANRICAVAGSAGCSLRRMSEGASGAAAVSGYLALRKGQRGLRRALNRALVRLWSSGSLPALRRHWLPSCANICRQPPAQVESLNVGEVLPLLLLPPLTAALAVLLLLAEAVAKHFRG